MAEELCAVIHRKAHEGACAFLRALEEPSGAGIPNEKCAGRVRGRGVGGGGALPC